MANNNDLTEFKSPGEQAAGGEENAGDAQAALILANAEAAGIEAGEAGDDVIVDTGTAGDGAAAADTEAGDGADQDKAPALTPRQKRMEEIAQKQNRARAEDAQEFIAAHGAPGQARDPDQVDADTDAQGHTDQQVQDAVVAQPEYRTAKNAAGVDCAVLKINGEEVLKPMKDLVALAQKEGAADLKLQKASTTMQSLQRWNTDLTAREQRVADQLKQIETSSKNSAAQPSDKDTGQLNEQSFRSFVEAIYDEDTDVATQHLQELLKGRSDPTQAMSKQEMQATVTALVTEQQQIGNIRAEREQAQANLHESVVQDWTEARATFEREYPEIKPGTNAWKMASSLSPQIQAEPEFKNASYSDIFREAGKRVRAIASDLTPQLKDRTAQKLTSQRHVASRTAPTQQRGREAEPAKALSQHDLIKNMRKQRRPNSAY